MNVLFSDFSFYGRRAFRVLSRWPVILTSFPTAFSTSFSISSSRSGGDVAYNLIPTTHTNFEFRRLYVLFEGLVNSIRCRLRRLLIRIIITRTLFYKFVCLVYVIVFSFRVFVLFSSRFNLNLHVSSLPLLCR